MSRDPIFIPEGGPVVVSTDRTLHGRCLPRSDRAGGFYEMACSQRPERPERPNPGRDESAS